MSWKDVSPREKLVWMVQYYIVSVLTTASTFQSHTTSPSKKNQTSWNAGKRGWTSRDWFLALNLIGWKSGAIFLDQLKSEVKHKQRDNGYFRHLLSSITRDFRDNRLTVLYAGYKKLSKDGDWGGVTACSLSVLHKLSGTILILG